MNEPVETWRSFVALDLSPAAKAALAHLQEHLRRKGLALAYTHMEDAHLTLAFLGEVRPPVIDALKPRLDEVAAGCDGFELKLGAGGFFGPPSSPRVAWVGVEESPVLMALQSAVAGAVRATGIELESRPFHPHLTVARIKNRLPLAALTLIKSSINTTTIPPVPVDRVLIMRSQPGGSGPKYSAVHIAHLKGNQHHG